MTSRLCRSRAGRLPTFWLPLFALAVLALLQPSGLYAQASCSASINPTLDLTATPPPFFVGSTVRVDLEIGVNAINSGTQLTIDQVEHALDCTSAGGSTVDTCTDATNKVAYQGITGTDCGVTFTASHALGATAPNTVVFTPDAPLNLAPNTGCTLSFNVSIEEDPAADGTPTIIETASRQEGQCDNGLDGSADGQVAISVETCAVSFDKQISCDDGVTFVDINQPDTIEGCISNGGQIVAKWIATNTGTADASCSISDDLISVPGGASNFDLTDSTPVEFESTPSDCSPQTAGVNTAELDCSCGGGNIILPTITDQAQHDCCAVTFDKQISCDGGNTFVDADQLDSIEGCISTGGDIVAKYVATNTGSTDATCTIGDDLLQVPASGVGFALSSTPVEIETDAAACDVGTSGVNTGTLDCACGPQGEVVLAQLDDQAEHGCCVVEIDKQVSCADGPFIDVTGADDGDGSSTETCVSWGAFDGMPAEGIDIQYFANNDGTSSNVVLNDCTLSETNPYTLDNPNMTSSIPVADDLTGLPTVDSTCDDTNLLAGETGGENTATLNCDCALVDDNQVAEVQVSDSDTAGFDCQTPGLMITKECVVNGNTADVEVTVTNTGSAPLLNCEVTDALDDDDQCNGPFDTDVPLSGDAINPADFALNASGSVGDEQVFDGTVDLDSTTCNQAAVTCTISGTEKQISSDVDELCVVEDLGCNTRTIGFWGNRSKFVDAVGPVQVCGQDFDGFEEIDDMLCARGEDILLAQCAAAVLNVESSLIGEGTCAPTTVSNALPLLATCCGVGENGDTCNGESVDNCIEEVTAFNESEDTIDCFELAPGVDFCSPGRNGPKKCTGAGGTGAGGPPSSRGRGRSR